MINLQYTEEYLYEIKQRHTFLAQLNNKDLIKTLEQNASRKENQEQSYEVEMKCAELQQIWEKMIAQHIVYQYQPFLNQFLDSVRSIWNDKNTQLLWLVTAYFNDSSSQYLPEWFKKEILIYLQNKEILHAKNMKRSYTWHKLHPSATFNLRALKHEEKEISPYGNDKYSSRVKCDLLLRPPYDIDAKRYPWFLLEICYSDYAQEVLKWDVNWMIANWLVMSAHQLAVEYCRESRLLIREYYQSSPNFACFVENICF